MVEREVTVGILALQGDVREHAAMMERLGANVVLIRHPKDLERVDGVIFPGGESTTLHMLIDSAHLREPLAERLRGGMATLGTCAGMILLASSVLDGRADQRPFGAIDLEVLRNGYGRQLDSFESEIELTGLPGQKVHGVFIRAPIIKQVAPNVEILASLATPSESRVPVACRQGAVTVTSFHPELAGETYFHEQFLADALR